MFGILELAYKNSVLKASLAFTIVQIFRVNGGNISAKFSHDFTLILWRKFIMVHSQKGCNTLNLDIFHLILNMHIDA